MAGELRVSADIADLRRASEWLDASCRQGGVPAVLAERLVLCLHEALANVIDHGGKAARSEPVELKLEIVEGPGRGEARVRVSDAGVAFDPLSVAPKPRPKSLDDASTGGRGLVLIRRCSDWVQYRHEGGRNHLTFGAGWEAK